MKSFRFFLWLIIIAVGLIALNPRAFADIAAQQKQTPVAASPAVTPPPAPAISTPTLPLAPLATQLGQTLQTLVTGTPGPSPNAQTDNVEDNVSQITDAFAASVLNTLTQTIDSLKANSANLSVMLSAAPDFDDWLDTQLTDPRRQTLWNDIGGDLPIIIGIPLLGGIAISLLLMPVRMNLRRNRPATLPGRVGLILSLFLLRIVPVVIALGAALVLLNQNETHALPRYIILNIIYAIALGLAVQQVLRTIFAPAIDYLRPLTLSTPHAVYAYRWMTAFSLVIIVGYFLFDIAADARVPANAIIVLENILGLILTVMTIIVICQTRPFVAAILRGSDSDDENGQSFIRAMRLWLARHWHSLTITYLVIGLFISLLGIDHGIELMLRGTIFTFGTLAAARLCFVALDRWEAPRQGVSSPIHRQILVFVLRPIIWMVVVISVARIWGYRLDGIMATTIGQRLTATVFSIAATLLILTAVYEFLNATIDRHLNRIDKTTKLPVATPRMRTLLPMLRNTIFIFFSSMAVLVFLSAIGINIGPLLAGAGVVGVAIGFGSQTLIKDFLTGLFIVAENTVSVGDIVNINTLGGVVEAISIRTIRLRDADGSLHILPFGEVSKITNMSKGFAYALVDINVAYDSDLEKTMNVLRDIGAQLQADPVFKRVILEPIEVMGVEKFNDSSITLRARIRTRPGKQWDVKRLLLLRIQQRFLQERIDLPFPTVTHIVAGGN